MGTSTLAEIIKAKALKQRSWNEIQVVGRTAEIKPGQIAGSPRWAACV